MHGPLRMLTKTGMTLLRKMEYEAMFVKTSRLSRSCVAASTLLRASGTFSSSAHAFPMAGHEKARSDRVVSRRGGTTYRHPV